MRTFSGKALFTRWENVLLSVAFQQRNDEYQTNDLDSLHPTGIYESQVFLSPSFANMEQ